jgi:hypothetical protein
MSSSAKQKKQCESPKAYFDEENRKVLIVETDPDDGNEVEHYIEWNDESDPNEIGLAIE